MESLLDELLGLVSMKRQKVKIYDLPIHRTRRTIDKLEFEVGFGIFIIHFTSCV